MFRVPRSKAKVWFDANARVAHLNTNAEIRGISGAHEYLIECGVNLIAFLSMFQNT